MTRIGFPLIGLAILFATGATLRCGVNSLSAQERVGNDDAQAGGRGKTRLPIGTVEISTRWAFRTLTPVSVSSPIVRLGDVVQPLNPDMAGWQRLKRSPIGLLPLGSQPMTIERARLERAILDAEATPLAIDWIGPNVIQVAYNAQSDQTPSSGKSFELPSATVAQVSHQLSSDVPVSTNAVSESEASRVIHWILLAIERQHSEISREFRIEIPTDQPGFASLTSIAGVNDLTPLDPIAKGDCRFRLTARSADGTIGSELILTLTPHPRVAVPRKLLPRGHRVMIHDLEMQPFPEEELEPDFVLDPEEVVGLEVHGYPRPGRPLSRSDLGMPTLIRRGDLIEVRVMGGGVTVTTNAKSQGDGAANELIEVETLTPRKRLLARVVQPGLVEIVTRAPKVQP